MTLFNGLIWSALTSFLLGGGANAQHSASKEGCRVAVAQWASLAGDHGGPSLLVVLSPRMVYALQEWPRMAAVARAQGFDIHAVRDARVPLEEWHEAVDATELPDLRDIAALDATTAASCQLANHWPAVLVMRCGQAHPWPVFGVMPDEAWRHVLRHRDAWLKERICP